MSSISRDDILVSLDDGHEGRRPLKMQVAAFVPITIAIIGILVILSGGLSAKPGKEALDPIATGSIAPLSHTSEIR